LRLRLQLRNKRPKRRVNAKLRADRQSAIKLTANTFIESFESNFRAECLNAHWFSSDDAREKCEDWHGDYNEKRPHSAISNNPPIKLVDRSVVHGPRERPAA
jgi:transposase InsO family protein